MNSIPPKRARTPTKGWHDIAIGEIGGNSPHWNPGYDILEAAANVIQRLEYLPKGQVDWPALIRDLPRFTLLSEILRRHSFNLEAWGELSDFSVEKGGADEEGNPAKWASPWESDWVYGWLSMNHDHKRRIFRDFEVLTQRLEEYPPLANFLGQRK
jgi:hypothetical protein